MYRIADMYELKNFISSFMMAKIDQSFNRVSICVSLCKQNRIKLFGLDWWNLIVGDLQICKIDCNYKINRVWSLKTQITENHIMRNRFNHSLINQTMMSSKLEQSLVIHHCSIKQSRDQLVFPLFHLMLNLQNCSEE